MPRLRHLRLRNPHYRYTTIVGSFPPKPGTVKFKYSNANRHFGPFHLRQFGKQRCQIPPFSPPVGIRPARPPKPPLDPEARSAVGRVPSPGAVRTRGQAGTAKRRLSARVKDLGGVNLPRESGKAKGPLDSSHALDGALTLEMEGSGPF